MLIGITATVFALLAAAVHVWIFVMESVTWTTPRTWRRFGIREQSAADAMRPMAFNQGFYNLFLAIGVVLGVVLWWTIAPVPGKTLALFGMACMVAAALVLALSGGSRAVRPALVQGVLPAAGLLVFALA